MNKPNYDQAVTWIALNDDAGELDVYTVYSTISVGLVADLFGIPTAQVARDVVEYRREFKSVHKEEA